MPSIWTSDRPLAGRATTAEGGSRNGNARHRVHVVLCGLSIVGLAATGCGTNVSHKTKAPVAAVTVPLVPKAGGTLIVATEAEVTSGFDPINSQWDATGYIYGNTVFDPLMAMGADGAYKPFLAESLTSNADFTRWTIKLRPNVMFSNGEVLNSDALKMNLEADRKSPLAALTLTDIAGIDTVDNLTVVVKMKTPWSTYPLVLAGQTGYPVAPKSLADPDRAQHPIGTGPFIMKEWNVGSHFTAIKNPHYWRAGLPLLDSIEFRPIVEPTSRANSLSAGTVDLIHTSDPQTILNFRKDQSVHLIEQTTGRVDINEVMLNTLKPPLDDNRIRHALAYATDRSRYNHVIGLGATKEATGPFSSGSGYANAPGYPDYNLQKARDLVTQYEKEKGVFDVSFELGTTNTASNLAGAQLLADMWSHAGIRANIVQVEQSSYINNAVLGNYDAYVWRQFGEADPDTDNAWWNSMFAQPKGSIALNFSRNKDPKIDQDLANARLTGDLAQRKGLYEDVSSQLNNDLPYIWTNQVPWGFASKRDVMGLDTPVSPEGVPLRAFQSAWSGSFTVAQIWRNTVGSPVAPVPQAPTNSAGIRDTTAIDVSKSDFPTAASAKAVVLTRDDLFLDAGGPLAVHVGGPLLFTPPAHLDAGTQAEIGRVLPGGGTVYLVGGTDALSDNVASTISGLGYHAVRVGGTNRAETAAAVAHLLAS